MNVKYEWKKQDKDLYLPKTEPMIITVPSFPFFTLAGQGDPNREAFAEAVGCLYALSYGVKMLPKKGQLPPGYFEYAVFPLEGIWDLQAPPTTGIPLNKDDLHYRIMIRQPSFVTDDLATQVLQEVKKKKPHPLLEEVRFEAIEDGLAVQIMHLGPFDDEPRSFGIIADFCADRQLVRRSMDHREIYISDPRKTSPDKMKTVLRIFVRKQGDGSPV